MIIKQITTTYDNQFAYLAGCPKTGKAACIDPGGRVDLILAAARESNLTIEYIFNTHFHADHTGGNRQLKKKTGAKLVIHALDAPALRQLINLVKVGTGNFSFSPKPDILLQGGEKIRVGEIEFEVIHTPGHTRGGVCFLAENNLFTGDTLFVGNTGKTSLPEGNREVMGESLRHLMFNLPGTTIVWPGHDYGPTKKSNLDWERRNNKNAVEYGFSLKEQKQDP